MLTKILLSRTGSFITRPYGVSSVCNSIKYTSQKQWDNFSNHQCQFHTSVPSHLNVQVSLFFVLIVTFYHWNKCKEKSKKFFYYLS